MTVNDLRFLAHPCHLGLRDNTSCAWILTHSYWKVESSNKGKIPLRTSSRPSKSVSIHISDVDHSRLRAEALRWSQQLSEVKKNLQTTRENSKSTKHHPGLQFSSLRAPALVCYTHRNPAVSARGQGSWRESTRAWDFYRLEKLGPRTSKNNFTARSSSRASESLRVGVFEEGESGDRQYLESCDGESLVMHLQQVVAFRNGSSPKACSPLPTAAELLPHLDNQRLENIRECSGSRDVTKPKWTVSDEKRNLGDARCASSKCQWHTSAGSS